MDDDKFYGKYAGIAFEPQFEIDTVNNHLRNIFLKPNQTYSEWIEYKIETLDR